MKKLSGLFGIILLLLLAASAHAATVTNTSGGTSGSTLTSGQDAASLVYVSSANIDPPVFYPYEQGTITVTLVNAGTSAVGLSNPDILSNKIHVINTDTWNTMSFIGPGSMLTYSFLVTADPPDGTYFPLFTVATQTGGSIHYPLIIKVDSRDIRVGVTDKPDNFSLEKTDTVNLSIINPRNGNIKNIVVTPSGTGIDVSPSEKFVSSLDGGSSINIPFSITPHQQSNLTFHLSYQNGDNDHTQDVILPINIGEDKTAAVPVMNNIAITSVGSSYKLTGDVNNAGVTDAKAMVLTVGAPAKAIEPYAEYSIGSLASDDFSSFDLTFSSEDLSSVPVVIRWKDSNGNSFSVTKNLDLRSLSSSGTSSSTSSSRSSGSTGGNSSARTAGGFGGGPGGGGGIFGFGGTRSSGISSFYPVIAAGIIVIAGIALWMKRKWIVAKLKKR
jgi:hypothetical protein